MPQDPASSEIPDPTRYTTELLGDAITVFTWDVRNDELRCLGGLADLICGKPGPDGWSQALRASAIVYEADLDRVRAAVRSVLTGAGTVYEVEYRVHTRYDEMRWMLARGKVLDYDDQGRVARLHGIVLDVTAARKAHDAEHLLTAALEYSGDSIVVCNAEDRIVFANRAFRDFNPGIGEFLLPGCTWRGHLVAGLARGMYPEAVGREDEWLEARMARRRDAPGSAEVRRQDGVWLRVSDYPLPGGGLITVGADISAFKQLQESRERDAMMQRNTLVREVHHRIKNNLQGITGLLGAHARSHPELAPLLLEAIGQIEVIARAHGLHGRGEHETTLGALLEEIVTTQRDLGHGSPILDRAACTSDWLLAEADAVPVALILNELVWNALKHRDPASRESVRVRLAPAGASNALVSIVNPAADAPPQGEALATPGTGLALVRALMPRAAGTLSIRGSGDGGVCAELELGPPVISSGPAAMPVPGP